jgi:hypothetical protein
MRWPVLRAHLLLVVTDPANRVSVPGLDGEIGLRRCAHGSCVPDVHGWAQCQHKRVASTVYRYLLRVCPHRLHFVLCQQQQQPRQQQQRVPAAPRPANYLPDPVRFSHNGVCVPVRAVRAHVLLGITTGAH